MRKVLEARFHQVPHMRGIGQLDPLLVVDTPKYRSVYMETDGTILLVTIVSKENGVKVEALVPMANVVSLLLAPEVEAIKPKSK